MSTILYLPTPQKTVIYCSQTERVAHDLKNCMSVLLLAITSLKDNQPLISASRKRVLENVVEEMNRLVDEMVRLAGTQVNK
jgi:triphosphoribosyl-dephospho-CoA synthetase